jgi:hypothetical protein
MSISSVPMHLHQCSASGMAPAIVASTDIALGLSVLFPYNAFSVRCSFSVQCVFCTMFFFRTMRFLYDVLFPYNAFSVRCSVSVQCFFCCPLICHLPLFLLLMLECRLRMACHARPAEDRGILLHIIAVFYLHLRLW